MKILKLIFCSLLLMSSVCLAQFKSPLLVVDMRNAPVLPKNFRSTSYTVPSTVNTKGLSQLHIAGGAQFSKLSFQRILYRIRQKHIYIIDLRQESHGFLNGNAVSWYAPFDAINKDKSDIQIEDEQTQLLEELGKQDIANVYTILTKSKGYITKAKPTEFAVHQVMSEEQFAKSAEQNYQRIYVQDTHRPTDEQVDRFLDIIKSIPKNKWIYFHCRAGVGRTTTFMAMYDMLHNAKNVSLEDILKRQKALGGKDLEAVSKSAHKKSSSLERYEFLQKFYEYAKTNQDNFATTWTQWLANQDSAH